MSRCLLHEDQRVCQSRCSATHGRLAHGRPALMQQLRQDRGATLLLSGVRIASTLHEPAMAGIVDDDVAVLIHGPISCASMSGVASAPRVGCASAPSRSRQPSYVLGTLTQPRLYLLLHVEPCGIN